MREGGDKWYGLRKGRWRRGRGSVWEDLEEGTRRSGRRSTLKNARTKVGEDEELEK